MSCGATIDYHIATQISDTSTLDHAASFIVKYFPDGEVTANRTLIGHKCAGVINAYSELYNIPMCEAFDTFYKSNLYTEIREGISDMHCRSDGYLAEELQIELSNKK